MTLHVVLHVVAEFKTTVTQSTIACNLHGMAFHVYCLVIPEPPSDYFLQSAFNMASILLRLLASLCLFYPPGLVFFLLHGVFTMARIL